ncbi:helix-turn-helix domain-containing protein [Isoptericola sp. NPDC058082]|uniref:helix-turn-helix domain-containing protein n=1 Tax=Isoptericola sp. NPDC058082 TaxID=3346331 RepID=UPI0036ED4E89
MHQRLLHGPAVRALREALGIKHGVFAVEVGISPGYLTHVEKGAKQPSPAVVASIAKRLGVSIDQITYLVSADAKASPTVAA